MARILILTPQLPIPPQALTGASQGTTIRNFSLIAGLAQHHTVDLLTFIAEGTADGVDLLRPYCRNIITGAPPVRSLARRGLDTFTRTLPDMALRLDTAEMRRQMGRLLAAEQYDVGTYDVGTYDVGTYDVGTYDVVQVEAIEMAQYGLMARSVSPRPRIVFDDHNAEYVLQKRACLTDIRRVRRWVAAGYSFVQWQKLAAYERRVCRLADAVVAVSDADRAALQRLSPGLAVTVVPNGVDLDFYRPGVVAPADIGPHSLVFTGKMDYRPNVDAVLWFADEALPLIRQQVADAVFYVVGQSPHPRLARLAGHPAVVVTGRVPDVRPYIAAAGVYVVPLRIGGGTRLKVLEAMAMGQAMVSTRLGCDGFAFEDGREVRFADEPAEFARAVISLLADRQAAMALGQAARQHVEQHFGWQAIIPQLEALYR
jgi:polysaccharide biosynthesis protein PslH